MRRNNLAFPISMWRVIRAGVVQVNINPNYSANERARNAEG